MLYSREKKGKLVAEVNKCLTDGLRDTRIAELLGISTHTISRWRQEGIVAPGVRSNKKHCASQNEVQPEQQTIPECEYEQKEPERKRLEHYLMGKYVGLRFNENGYKFRFFTKDVFRFYKAEGEEGFTTDDMGGKELGGKLLDLQAELQQIIQFIRR